MRVLRLLANGLISGLFFCLLLALLVLDLNINHRPEILDFPRLAVLLFPTYGLLTALGAILVASIYRFFVTRPARKGFLSPRFLSLGFSLLTLVFLVVFRENMIHFASFFVPAVRRAMQIQMTVLFASAAAGLVLLYRYFHGRRRPALLIAYFAAAGAAFILAVVLRLGFPAVEQPIRLSSLQAQEISRKVTILNLEGLSFEFIFPLVNKKALPSFSYLMEQGSWGHLSGFTPSDSVVLRRTLRTGKLPGKHRRLSGVRYRIPGFPDTLEVVPRFILFRQLTQLGLLEVEPFEPPPAVKDIEMIYGEEQAVVVRSEAMAAERPETGASPAGATTDKLFLSLFKDLLEETAPVRRILEDVLTRDRITEERAFLARQEIPPQLFVLTLDGLSDVQSYFYKYSNPAEFGEIRPDEIQKFGPVIERYYQYYDQIISKYTAAMKDDELLIVCSPYGVEPLPFWKRLVEWVLGNPDVSAYHEQAPDG
ncbi:MAG: alkaline phosphatase family protein, partial [Candidatus Aminicenantes bacterium]|nr:alkaline phosphatase family protein [Candidatus Aminicenantes bacterium]